MHPVRLTYGDVGDAEKLEKDRTLMLRPIVTDRMRPATTRTLLEVTRRRGPVSGLGTMLRPIIT